MIIKYQNAFEMKPLVVSVRNVMAIILFLVVIRMEMLKVQEKTYRIINFFLEFKVEFNFIS